MNIIDYALRKQDEATLRASPLNLLAGVTPSISGFTTTPSDIDNATDADPTNPTGVGTKQPGGVEFWGYLEYDLGSAKYVDVSGMVKMWCASAIALYLEIQYKINSGDTYISFPYSSITIGAAASSEPTNAVPFQYTPKVYGRYIRFALKAGGSASGDASFKAYELAAYELKLAAEG